MKIAISGKSGFMGSRLDAMFSSQGHQVKGIGREAFSLDAAALSETLRGTDMIIHLAGAPILKRWTSRYQREIYDSRILTTRRLADAMHFLKPVPHTFICASATGIYPGSGIHDEHSTTFARDFLGKVCRDWELAASRAPSGCRTLMFRFGIILGKEGGALRQMLGPFRLGLGGPVAGGRQKMSWIHIEDVLGATQFILDNKKISGPVNICSPVPVTNEVFTKTLARTLGRPAFMPLPGAALRLVYGKGASVLTGGQHVVPAKLEAHRYRFRFPRLESALKDLVS